MSTVNIGDLAVTLLEQLEERPTGPYVIADYDRALEEMEAWIERFVQPGEESSSHYDDRLLSWWSMPPVKQEEKPDNPLVVLSVANTFAANDNLTLSSMGEIATTVDSPVRAVFALVDCLSDPANPASQFRRKFTHTGTGQEVNPDEIGERFRTSSWESWAQDVRVSWVLRNPLQWEEKKEHIQVRSRAGERVVIQSYLTMTAGGFVYRIEEDSPSIFGPFEVIFWPVGSHQNADDAWDQNFTDLELAKRWCLEHSTGMHREEE